MRSDRDLLASSNGKVETSLHRGIDSVIQRLRLATTKRHVGNRTLVLGLASDSELLLRIGISLGSLLSCPPTCQLIASHPEYSGSS